MSFKILMDILNATLQILNSKGYHIRDKLDQGYYISEIYYDPNNDELYFDTKEEVIPKWSAD